MSGPSHLFVVSSSLLSLLWSAAGVPPHAHFTFDPTDGLIRLKEKPELHLNVQGGDIVPGKPIIIWPSQSLRHEMFEHVNGQLRSIYNPDFCLNAEGGPNIGAPIVMWPCGKPEDGSMVEHEQFDMDSEGRIKLKTKPDMCLNVKGSNFVSGVELILWACQGTDNERFKIEDSMIKLQTDDTLHLNIAGGKVEEGSKVVIFHTHAGAHEVFELANIEKGEAAGKTSIRLKNEPALCMNAENGAFLGRQIVLWPCQGFKSEAFQYNDADNTIRSVFDPDLAFNAAGGAMQPGDGVVLWPLKENEL